LPASEPIILVGHSYGSLVVTGVAKRLPERLQGLIYLDSPVPVHTTGEPQCLLDILGPEVEKFFMSVTVDRIVKPFPPEAFGLSPTEHAEFIDQHTAQSLKCFTEKVNTWAEGETCTFKDATILNDVRPRKYAMSLSW
jgi:thioesterase domain-containing protein